MSFRECSSVFSSVLALLKDIGRMEQVDEDCGAVDDDADDLFRTER